LIFNCDAQPNIRKGPAHGIIHAKMCPDHSFPISTAKKPAAKKAPAKKAAAKK
jgi:hypothetical protein